MDLISNCDVQFTAKVLLKMGEWSVSVIPLRSHLGIHGVELTGRIGTLPVAKINTYF